MRYAKPRKFEHTSRYRIYRQIVDDDNNTYIETSNQTPVEESQYDQYHEVQTNEEGRLDIIANIYYKNPQYWWAIALANDIIDPFVVTEGTILRIPNFSSLSRYGGALYGRV